MIAAGQPARSLVRTARPPPQNGRPQPTQRTPLVPQMPNPSNTLPHLPPAARIISRAAVALLVLAAAALAAGRAYGQTGAASENINLAAARNADGTSATLTWPPPTQPSYQWIFVAAKVSPEAPNTTSSIDASAYRCAGQLLLNTASTPPVSNPDPDTEYVYDHTSLRI